MFCTSQSICCLQKHPVYQCLPAWGPPVVCRQAALFLSLHCLVQLSFCFVTSPWSKNEQNCCQGDITVTVNHGSCRAPPRHPHNRASQAAQKDWWGLVTPWYGATCWGGDPNGKIKNHQEAPPTSRHAWRKNERAYSSFRQASASFWGFPLTYASLYLYKYVYIYIYLCVCLSVFLSVCLPARTYVCACICICVCVHTYLHLFVCASICAYVCRSVRLYLCMYV